MIHVSIQVQMTGNFLKIGNLDLTDHSCLTESHFCCSYLSNLDLMTLRENCRYTN